jgi:hypothetical protein
MGKVELYNVYMHATISIGVLRFDESATQQHSIQFHGNKTNRRRINSGPNC